MLVVKFPRSSLLCGQCACSVGKLFCSTETAVERLYGSPSQITTCLNHLATCLFNPKSKYIRPSSRAVLWGTHGKNSLQLRKGRQGFLLQKPCLFFLGKTCSSTALIVLYLVMLPTSLPRSQSICSAGNFLVLPRILFKKMCIEVACLSVTVHIFIRSSHFCSLKDSWVYCILSGFNVC